MDDDDNIGDIERIAVEVDGISALLSSGNGLSLSLDIKIK
jgi:hypothetical protein